MTTAKEAVLLLLIGFDFSLTPECLDLFAIQDAIVMVAAGRRVTAQAQISNVAAGQVQRKLKVQMRLL